eukprot:g36088.t1
MENEEIANALNRHFVLVFIVEDMNNIPVIDKENKVAEDLEMIIITKEVVLARTVVNGDPVDVLYLVFQKAFDKVPHKRLLHKIEVQQVVKKANGILSFIATGIEFESREVMLQLYRVLVQQGVITATVFSIFIITIPHHIKNKLLNNVDIVYRIANLSRLKFKKDMTPNLLVELQHADIDTEIQRHIQSVSITLAHLRIRVFDDYDIRADTK